MVENDALCDEGHNVSQVDSRQATFTVSLHASQNSRSKASSILTKIASASDIFYHYQQFQHSRIAIRNVGQATSRIAYAGSQKLIQ